MKINAKYFPHVSKIPTFSNNREQRPFVNKNNNDKKERYILEYFT